MVGSKASRAGAEDVVDLDHRAIGVWMVPLWPAGARHVVNFPCAPTYPGGICRCGHRFLGPPTVPLTVLGGDGQANDSPLTRIRLTTPGHIPAHQTPLRTPASQQDTGSRLGQLLWSVCAPPLMGGRAAPPPRGGLGCCSRLCCCVPDPLWGAGLPRPPVGGWGGYSRALWNGRRWLAVTTHLD